MIKTRCPICQRYYLGPACPCETGARPRRLACACGREAVEVWIDDLGEWPLCTRCLAQVQFDLAPPALSESGSVDAEARTEGDIQPGLGIDPGDEGPDAIDPPLDLEEIRQVLSPREFEVAQLAHLSNRQIADRLGISIGTVKTQLRSIRQKLGLRTRGDVIRVFSTTEENLAAEKPAPPLTFSLTIKGPMDRLYEVISRLVRGR